MSVSTDKYLPQAGAMPAFDEVLANTNSSFTGLLPIDMTHSIMSTDNNYTVVGLGRHPSSFREPFTLDEISAFEDYTTPKSQLLPTRSLTARRDKKTQPNPAWCNWTDNGVSPLAVLTVSPLIELDSNTWTYVDLYRPHARNNADIITQSLRSFPTMMLRRETLPWFIHKQSQILSQPGTTALPPAISTCMSISQMFALSTPETKRILWNSIRDEHCRFTNEVCHLPNAVVDYANHR
jgi:hypothetical protein